MKTATGLTLLVIGAILAFAVTTNTSVFNLHVAGYVIMLAGLAGLFIPRKEYSRLSRRLVQRRTRAWPNGTVVETRETEVPPYVVENPNVAREDAGLPAVPSIPPDPTVAAVMTPGTTTTGTENTEFIQQLRDE
ncbi:MAG TPA: hypothetical protein VGH27_24690 [Streptosporangiaceae bacterium]|jgi:hypothetical protein